MLLPMDACTKTVCWRTQDIPAKSVKVAAQRAHQSCYFAAFLPAMQAETCVVSQATILRAWVLQVASAKNTDVEVIGVTQSHLVKSYHALVIAVIWSA